MLSDAQFSTLAETANSGGGFSVRAYGPQAGEVAKDGFMVGIPGHGADYAPTASASDARSFVESRADQLRPEGRYFGGWGGGTPSRTSFDVAQRFDRTPGGSTRARLLAARSNQEAIGEVDETGDYVGDINVPGHRTGEGHALQKPSPEQLSWAFDPIKRRR